VVQEHQEFLVVMVVLPPHKEQMGLLIPEEVVVGLVDQELA
jgi:hypothetical protein